MSKLIHPRKPTGADPNKRIRPNLNDDIRTRIFFAFASGVVFAGIGFGVGTFSGIGHPGPCAIAGGCFGLILGYFIQEDAIGGLISGLLDALWLGSWW